MAPTFDSEPSQATQARRFYVSGQVQGVGYRYFARDAAEKIGLGGYVRNLLDGRVEVYAIGSRSIAWLLICGAGRVTHLSRTC